MKRATVSLALGMAMVFCTALIAQATPFDDAKAVVDKAVAYWKANGKEKTIAEINNPKGQFSQAAKAGSAVVASDFNGQVLAFCGKPGMVGQNHLELRDPNGKYFVKELIEVAKTKGTGTVDFIFADAATKKVRPVTLYVKRIEGADFLIQCGIFH